MEELPAERAVGDAVDVVADDGQVDRREVDADLVHAAGLELTRSSACPGQSRSTSKCVIASRGVSVSSETRVGSSRSRPIGASIAPGAASAAGRGRARGRCARAARSRTSADSRSCASSERATTISPDVSRSSRWTIPVRPGLPAADDAGERVDERAAGVPRARVDDEAGRLVDDREVLVLPGERRRLGRRRRRDLGRVRELSVSPPSSR